MWHSTSPRCHRLKHEACRSGFTLAELLIALAILGIIAVFTIPKVLQAQQYEKTKAMVKEVAGMMAETYTVYKRANTPTVNTGIRDLTQYMNYVKVDTTGTYDTEADDVGTVNCSVSEPCLRLHNGALVAYHAGSPPIPGNGNHFGVLNANHYIYFRVDPDGTANTTTTNDGPGKAMTLVMFYNGRVTTLGKCSPTTDETYGSGTPVNYCSPDKDPSWFSWD